MDYKKALTRTKTVKTIMLTEEEKLVKVTGFKATSGEQLMKEIRELIKFPKLTNLIQKAETSNEKVVVSGKQFGAIQFEDESQATQFLEMWQIGKNFTQLEIEFEKWSNIRDRIIIGNVPSPPRKGKKLSLEELSSRLFALEVRTEENARKSERLEQTLQDEFSFFRSQFKLLLDKN